MTWFWNNFGSVITAVLAVYGAFLSSYNFWLTKKRDKKALDIKTEIIPRSPDILTDVIITVINKSLRPITINEIGLKYDPSIESKLSKPVDYPDEVLKLPVRLETSNQFSYHVPCCYSANQNDKADHFDTIAVPYAIDNEGQRYKGAPLEHRVFFMARY